MERKKQTVFKSFFKTNIIRFTIIITVLVIFLDLSAYAIDVRYSYDSLNRVIKTDYSNGIMVEYTYDAAVNRLLKETAQSAESDGDGYFDNWDNCLTVPNGPGLGTCVRTVSGVVMGFGVSCNNDGNCETGETCQMAQGDINANGIGDACECYADCNNSTNVDIFDLLIMKNDYNSTNCPCDADLNVDGGVDVFDLLIMKNQYNRTGCPVAL